MEFINNYYTPMDREFYTSNQRQYTDPSDEIEKPIIHMSDIKPSITEGRAGGGSFRNGILQRLRMGASGAELNLMPEGAEPGTGPEAYGKEAREEIKQLTSLNKFKITVHAPVQTIPNISGFTGQEFSEQRRSEELNEIKKAISFAADIASDKNAPDTGIPVVIHTGEFPRAIAAVEAPKNEKGELLFEENHDKPKIKRGPFEAYENESEELPVYVVDEKTGKVIGGITADKKIPAPVWKKASERKTYYDDRLKKYVTIEPGDYVDNYGRLALSPEDRVIETDENSNLKIESFDLRDFDKERQSFMKWIDKVKNLTQDVKDIDPETKQKIKHIQETADKLKDQPRETFFIRESLLAGKRRAEGLAQYHIHDLENIREKLNKIHKAISFFKELKNRMGEKAFNETFSEYVKKEGLIDIVSPSEKENPLEYLEKARQALEKQYKYSTEVATGHFQEAKEIDEQLERIKTLEEFAKEKSMKTLAEAGVYAYQETKAKNLKKPVYIAPENIFPEMGYGSHPDELAELVKGARQKMIEELTKRYNMKKSEAEKIAKDHIKATLDTQHLSMWYKYFNPPGKKFKNEEERKKAFADWYKKQIEKLAKEGIIGHVHLVDGFGRAHVHLPAGQGDAPVKEAIEILKKHNVPFDIVSEGYAEGPRRQLTKVWEKFDVPVSIFGSGYKPATSWTNIDHSYFDKKSSPNYIFGSYAPSQDWSFWSEVPLE
ncbi:MAG: hypothetical protein PWP03_383 [Candidatus Woesearchaeota archaeon]|nr:hypothetical protein [Candidatus Woesearchaeota archaeon]